MRKIRDNTPQKCTKCDRTFYYTTVCPYCHTDIDTGETVSKKGINSVIEFIVGILLVIGILFLISQCAKDDGSCERCNKEGVYEIGGDKYCEKHYLDVLGEVIAWDGD